MSIIRFQDLPDAKSVDFSEGKRVFILPSSLGWDLPTFVRFTATGKRHLITSLPTIITSTSSSIKRTDLIEPETPIDLSVESVSSNRLDLTWSLLEVGHDGILVYLDGQEVDDIGESVKDYSFVGLDPSTTYTLSVQTYIWNNKEKVTSNLVEVSGQTSGEEFSDPGVVTDLSVSSTTPSSITLSFTEVDDGTGNPAFYHVRWGDPGTEWHEKWPNEIEDTSGNGIGTSHSITVDGLESNTEYAFQIIAWRDEDTNVFGSPSDNLNGTTDSSLNEPSSPSNFALSSSTSTSIQASWTDNSDNEDLFRIQIQSPAGGDWSGAEEFTTPSNSEDRNISGRDSETEYDGRVRAENDIGPSGWSNTDTTTTPASGGGDAGQNEPSGFTQYVDFDYSTKPPKRSDDHREDLMVLMSEGGTNFMRHIIEAGIPAGSSFYYPWHQWNTGQDPQDFPQLREIYVYQRYRYPSGHDDGWEQNNVGTKHVYFNHGKNEGSVNALFTRPGGLKGEGWCNGSGTGEGGWIMPEMPFVCSMSYYRNDQKVRDYYYNVHPNGTSWFYDIGCDTIQLDAWQEMELYMKLNDPPADVDADGNIISGAANGIYRLWIDGSLRHSDEEMLYVTEASDGSWSHTFGFGMIKMATIWGGTSGERVTEDYIDFRRTYISGVPQ